MVVALSNPKGGVGKSTIAAHLAVWMFEQGKRIVFVDSDAQGSSSKWLSIAADKLKTVRLQAYEDIIAELPGLKKDFDYVVADCPAGLSNVTRAILYFSDLAVLPCGPSVFDLEAVDEVRNIVSQIQELRDGLPRDIIVPTKVQPNYVLSKEFMTTLRNRGVRLGSAIRHLQGYIDAVNQRTVVWRMGTRSARQATAELEYLFQELLSYESTITPNKPGAVRETST